MDETTLSLTSSLPDTEQTNPGRLLELAVTLANQAGRTVVDMRPSAVASAKTKSSPTDPVTAADSAAEQIIVDGILARRPNDTIVGEEGANHQGTSGVEWFIDPIDGTTNYLYDIPAYSVSIAASVDGVATVGVVNNPVTNELFTAVAGQGSYRNGEALSVRSGNNQSSSLIATGFSYHEEQRAFQSAVLSDVLPKIRDIRRFGSAALDLCAVAMGRVDGYYEASLNVWDYAAGVLIVQEAGGTCEMLKPAGAASEWLVAGSAELSQWLTGLIMAPRI